MADKKLSEELDVGTLDGTELVRVTKGGATGRTTLSAAAALGGMLGGLTSEEVSVVATTSLNNSALGRMHACSGVSSDYIVTLPAATGNAGRVVALRMTPGLTRLVTVAAQGSDLIDGSATRVMWASEVAILMSTGSAWTKIAGRSVPMRVVARNSSSRSVPSAAWSQIAMETLVTDNTAALASPAFDALNGRFQAPRAGCFKAGGFVSLKLASAGTEMYVGVSKNSAAPTSPPFAFAALLTFSSGNTRGTAAGEWDLAAGDWLGCITFIASGSPYTNVEGAEGSSLSVTESLAW